MTWAPATAMVLAGVLITGGVIGLIVGLVRDERRRQRELNAPDMSVGRDVWRDIRGTHR